MKLNQNRNRKIAAAAVMMAAAATLSMSAFAAEDDAVVAGYLPPQEQMVQGDIALHTGDQLVEEGTFGGYAAPEGEQIQGDIMLISADIPVETAEDQKVPVAAGLTMTGLLRKPVLFTARQDGQVLTMAARHHRGSAGPDAAGRGHPLRHDQQEDHHPEPDPDV